MSNAAFAGPRRAGAGRRGAAPAPRRAALPRRLRHVPPRPSATCAVVDERAIRDPGRLPRAARPPARGSRPRSPSIRCRRVPCHNDLLAENYLDDGERLWIVDYEYSGNNDPTFELGNTVPGARLGRRPGSARCAPPTSATATAALLARMRLQMIMSDVGWTLWAAIQAAISTIDYDFWGWAERALGARPAGARRAGLRAAGSTPSAR